MTPSIQPTTILVADDDPDDRLLIEEAMKEANIPNAVSFAANGVEVMEQLRGDGADLPGLLLLDLNMPRKDGREVIAEVKSDPRLKRLPIVVLTTSDAETDITRSYDLGANSYIKKPVSYEGLLEVMSTLRNYWLGLVELPE